MRRRQQAAPQKYTLQMILSFAPAASLGTAPVEQSRVNPRALRAHLKAEVDRWGPILKKAGVNPE